MNKCRLYFLGILFFTSSVCFGVNLDNNKTQNINSDFNLNNQYAKNQYLTMEYGSYDPEKARQQCWLRGVPKDAIWLKPAAGEEPLPNPEPTNADCGNHLATGDFNVQMAYGCKVDPTKPDSIGARLSRSVFKIIIPNGYGGGSLCSAVLIDKQWMITAAHCVASSRFKSALSYEAITVPIGSSQYKVDKIIISAGYEDLTSPGPLPYKGYTKEDFALLHLEKAVPSYYIPIEMAINSFHSDGPIPVWVAGYGYDENSNPSKGLSFRQQYFMTKIYGGWYTGTQPGNYHEIYTVGSMPTVYKGEASAWSFNGGGDSGGPILWEDKVNNRFLLEGIQSGSLFCQYAGYFAKLPYPYDRNVSIPDYHEFITSIMNDSVEKDKIRCISPFGSCSKNNMYVINRTSKTIVSYNVLSNGDLIKDSSATTGAFPTAIATIELGPDKQYIFVTNYTDSSISSYKRNKNGTLVKLRDDHVMSPDGSGPIDIKILGSYAYVVEYMLKKVSIYRIGLDGKLTFLKFMDTHDTPSPMTIIKNDGIYYGLILNPASRTISIYSLDIVNGSKSFYIKDIPLLGRDYGKEMLKINGLESKNSFYLMTTQGLFLMSLEIDSSKQLSFKYLTCIFHKLIYA